MPEFEDPGTLFTVNPVVTTPPTTKPLLEQGESESVGVESVGVQGFTETDLMALSEAMWSIPSLIWNKIELRTQEQLTPFNRAFYQYCVRKGMDPFELFFAEFPLVMAVVGVGGGIYREYKEKYPGKKEKNVRAGDRDYEHQRDVDDERERKQKNGESD